MQTIFFRVTGDTLCTVIALELVGTNMDFMGPEVAALCHRVTEAKKDGSDQLTAFVSTIVPVGTF
jgi:hypothetical protein